jgi:transposase InsO family protein
MPSPTDAGSGFWPWSMTISRECLALVVDTSLSGLRVTRELDALIRLRGRPATVVSDNGTELTSMVVLKWCQETGVDWHYIPANPFSAFASNNAERLCRELQWQLQGRVSQ